jgi:protein TonB
MVVAGGVLLAHVLLLWLAMLARMDPGTFDTVEELMVTMAIGPPGAHQAPRDAVAEKPAAVRLQSPATFQAPIPEIQGIVVDLPEVEVPTEQPVVPVDAAVTASNSTATDAEAGLAGDAVEAGGRAGGGDGLVLLQRVMPVYPAVSVRRGEQGVTSVEIHVTPGGRVDKVRVVRSSGSRDLDRAAESAFRKWRFAPLKPGAPPEGKWVRTMQRFILYRFQYSRLDPRASDSVMEEYMKPKGGVLEEETAGGREALLRFITEVREQAVEDPDRDTQKGLVEMRAILEQWGAVKSASYTGLVGSSRWMRHRVRQDLAGSGDGTVEVSWNMYEVRHENSVSAWLIAMDRDGRIWDARASKAPWQ